MAFYHTGGCDCPVGCCDCGEPRAPTIYYVYYDPITEKIFTSTKEKHEQLFFRKFGNQFVPEHPKDRKQYYLGEL